MTERPLYWRIDEFHHVWPSLDPTSWFGASEGRVGLDHVGDAKVSTVFLGLDHAWSGPPMLFETMIFGGPFDERTRRYTTWEQAAAGHRRTVAALRRLAARSRQ